MTGSRDLQLDMEAHLDSFKCQYYQLVPARDFKLPSDESGTLLLGDVRVQDRLITAVLDSNEIEVSAAHRKSIIKLLMRAIEQIGDAEMDERFVEMYTAPVESIEEQARDVSTAEERRFRASEAALPRDRLRTPSASVKVHYFYMPAEYLVLWESPSILAADGTTGHKTWEAALALGDHLLATGASMLLRDRTVLELGAGTGFLSLLSARLGALRVLATDGSESMVDSLDRNIKLNGESARVSTRRLWFGHKADHGDEKVDVLMGADVTYDESILQPLCATIDHYLNLNPQMTVLIAATVRREKT